jgi:hypothetical protein
MSVSKDDRDAYKKGKSDRKFALNNPVGALFGGVGNPPSDSDERKAYEKGLKGESTR